MAGVGVAAFGGRTGDLDLGAAVFVFRFLKSLIDGNALGLEPAGSKTDTDTERDREIESAPRDREAVR